MMKTNLNVFRAAVALAVKTGEAGNWQVAIDYLEDNHINPEAWFDRETVASEPMDWVVTESPTGTTYAHGSLRKVMTILEHFGTWRDVSAAKYLAVALRQRREYLEDCQRAGMTLTTDYYANDLAAALVR